MLLSERLTRIAGFVPKGSVVADIGTDHALLPIYLILQKISPRAIACDLCTGPLETARANVILYGVEKSVEIRQGDGLESLNPGEAGVIVISGMGGAKITDILSPSPTVLDAAGRLILQPQSGAGILRRWLFNHGWTIIDEDLLLEHERFYEIIIAEHSPDPGLKISRKEEELLDIGPCLVEKKHPLLVSLLQEKISLAENVLRSLRHAKTPAARKMRREWRKKIDLCRRVIKNVS